MLVSDVRHRRAQSRSLSCAGLMPQSDKIFRKSPRPSARPKGNDGGSTVLMTQEMVTASGPLRNESRRFQGLFPLDAGGCSCGDRDPLNADKLQVGGLLTFHFKAKLNGFADFYHEFVERCAIGVTSRQLGYGGNVQPLFISLDHDIKLAHHILNLSALMEC
jgi:hypothetical protein